MEESELDMLLHRMRMLEKEIKPGILQTRCKQLMEDLTCSGDFENSLNILSQYLFDRDLTVAIGKCFPNLVLQLISNIMPSQKNATLDENGDTADVRNVHLEYCLILGKLIVFHPDVLQFSLQYFSDHPSPFEYYLESKPISKKRKILNLPFDSVKEIEVVECCFNFLNVAADVFRQKWNWSQFINKFLCNFDPMVKWLTCQCISLLFGTSEYQLHRLERVVLGDDKKSVECLMKYIAQNDSKLKCIPSNEPSTTSSINFHFLRRVVNVAGVLLPVFDSSNKRDGFLVPVESTQDNLRSLALAVASGKATCLIGPVGCGKTSLVEHLAALTGRNKDHLRKVQLGDQTDSRTLLGTYRCTDIPGEFVWQPGVLTQAVQKGQWLLLEDIDCAAIDVASVLSSLLERNVLSVPGYRDALPVAPGFQLFVTQRTLNTVSGYQKQTSTASALLQKHWAQIYVEPLSRQELVTVVETLFPTLKTISSRMVDVFMLFSVGSHQSSLQNTANNEKHAPLVRTLDADTSDILALKSGRLTSTRDLIKWCTRAVVDFNVVSQDSALKVLQDAIDIFACSVPEQESRVPLAIGIGAFLGIVETKAEYYCNTYKPNVSLQPSSLIVGRATTPRKEVPISSVNLHEKKATFSFTRRSTCLLERIACCVNSNEPVLLVGETGTGKTSSIQYLAKETGHRLVVINMNQQSDSSDLLGGYKPVDLKYVISPIRNEFESLFRSYFDGVKNAKFLTHISTCFNNSDWKTLLALMTQSQIAAVRRLCNTNIDDLIKSGLKKVTDPSNELEKTILLKRWRSFGLKLAKIDQQLKSQMSLAFAFIEGSLVKALKEGHWVLLDEINLASAETLECLSGLLESSHSSINLLERGDDDVIERHKDFTLFACMNPATDVGKRDLPAGLRNRFTEFYVEELTDRNDLMLLVGDYLRDMSIPPSIFESIYKFYINIRKEAKLTLMDGTGQSPHYSLRTLCRALAAAPTANCGTVTRSLYETTCLSFLTQLDSASHPIVEAMIANAVLGKKNLKSVMKQPIPEPKLKGQNFIPFEGYWICQGNLKPTIPDEYVLTSSVRKNLRDLVRIISLGKLPILLQGDTSVGKTSLITFIAKASGNRCVRINNHQHTDLQEYVGSYATDANGKLVFREGVLVEAMRKGYWIILDELNLAPSDVLEALNRVLDDNRELFIPETQQVVKADPNFMLFATQNPPGLYGGRKLLSRAFRNRFVELHFDEIPRPELETILHQRCHMPPSYCKKVITVMSELQARRKGSAAVQGKEGFITLRDLFRWGQRYRVASDMDSAVGKYYDWDQHIADEGYLVLAGRVRQPDERKIIREVLQKHIKRSVDPENLFTLSAKTSPVTREILETIVNSEIEEFKHVVWTFNMRRLAVLVAKCFTFKEPVLLVGETGCGKTTVCQVIAALRSSRLLSVNCHMHTEGSDFLGGLRPVRNYNNDGKLFEWADGPLIDAMKTGQLFLADEISLADDSVLERLNSLLEPERQLLLAEKGLDLESDSACVVTAVDGFHFIGTMNPGGDYGKKELSPALRNRFTEIWCDHVTVREDLLAVLERSIKPDISLGICQDGTSGIGHKILDFVYWFKNTKIGERFPCSIRDLLSWVHFINSTTENNSVDTSEAFVHGASLIFLDCFGTGLSGAESAESLNAIRNEAIEFVINQVKSIGSTKIDNLKKLLLHNSTQLLAQKVSGKFGINPFYISCGVKSKISNGDIDMDEDSSSFSFTAPTTGVNTMRLLRGLQLKKAILLEGSPGVGKTSLVTALAKISGHKILRINLSDQTDISDLFGADLPTEDGSFAWREGAFLTALQNGDWILLDELNLAPQAVLEGLNACLDHRGEIFIPELGRTFKVKQGTRIFACQNPLRQGGSRRGLPQSFLNRFTQVYVDTLSSDDLLFITSSQYPDIPSEVLQNMITMNSKILTDTSELLWGHRGSPWELNLRDIQRWCDGIMKDCRINENNVCQSNDSVTIKPGKMAQLLYVDRMRTTDDKTHVKTIYEKIFYPEYPLSSDHPFFYITEENIHIGDSSIKRNSTSLNKNVAAGKNLLVLRNQLTTLKSLIQCVNMNWLSILVGPTASGKSSCVQVLAQLIGKELKILPVTSAMDTIDILGGFEQADYNRYLEDISMKVESILMSTIQHCLLSKEYIEAIQILKKWEEYKDMGYTNSNVLHTMEEETNRFNLRQGVLKNIMTHLSDKNKGNDFCDAIADMLERLQRLNALVLKEGSINAGGKFEWVDSLLVKCLLDGSWLLIDNVNLCSSAVLDRLNGLLEPNGVLSIPERGGVNNDIKPHPDFRMFFTMDPKNGEISRAMRNRGVEIYIVGSEETPGSMMTDTIPILDMSAMLSSTGLPPQCKNLVILAHQKMCSLIDGYEKPSQCHLLQAAFLTSQQILRGESIKEAVINSFSDVYIKSRTATDFIVTNQTLAEHKNRMLKALECIVKTDLKVDNYHIEEHTFSTVNLQTVSKLETVKQQSFWLKMALKSLSSSNVKVTPEHLSKVAYLVFHFYHLSTKSDCNLRYDYFNYLYSSSDFVDNKSIQVWLYQLNRSLYDLVSTYASEDELNSYPWDLQFLPELSQLKNHFDRNHCNKLSVLLYYFTIKAVQDFDYGNEKKMLSALDYSKNVRTGKTMEVFQLPVLKNCSLVFEVLEKTLFDFVNNKDIGLSNDDLCEIVQLLHWRNRFYTVCNEPLMKTISNKKSTLRDDIVINLNIHYKWLSKFLKPKLFAIYGEYLSTANFEYFDDIKDRFFQTPLRLLCKHFRRHFGQPPRYPNEETSINCKNRNNLLSQGTILKSFRHNLSSGTILNIHVGKYKACKRVLKSFKNAYKFPDNDFANTLSEIENYEAYKMMVEGVQIVPPLGQDGSFTEIGSLAGVTNLLAQIELWPIKEYLILRMSNLYKVRLFECFLEHFKAKEFPWLVNGEVSKNDPISKKIIVHLSEIVDCAPAVPIKLYSLLSDLTIIQDKPDSAEILCMIESSSEMWDEFTKYLAVSPSTNPSHWLKSILTNEFSKSDDESENVEQSQMLFDHYRSLIYPHLTHNTVKLIVQNQFYDAKGNFHESSIIPAPLTKWQSRSQQLETFHLLLCRNMVTLNEESLNFHSLDKQVLIANFERMVLSLTSAMMRKNNDMDEVRSMGQIPTSKILSLCIEKITKTYHLENASHCYFESVIFLKDYILEWLQGCQKNLETVERKLKSSKVEGINGSNVTVGDDVVLNLGQAWTLFAASNLIILSQIGLFDPVTKEKLKLKYIEDDLHTLDSLIDVNILQGVVQGNLSVDNNESESLLSWNDSKDLICSTDGLPDKESLYKRSTTIHPHAQCLIEAKIKTAEKASILSKSSTYRQPDANFSALVKDLLNFIASVGSPVTIREHYLALTDICFSLIHMTVHPNSFHYRNYDDVIKKYMSWLNSINYSYIDIKKKYSHVFPDLTKPFLNAITQLIYGLDILRNLALRLIMRMQCVTIADVGFLDRYMEDLIRFPFINGKCKDFSYMIENLTSSTECSRLLTSKLKNHYLVDDPSDQCRYRLLMNSLHEFESGCLTRGSVSVDMWDTLSKILVALVCQWQKQQQAIQKKKEEEDLLYVNRTKCDDPTEEEEFEKELVEMFPSYSDSDFSDFKLNLLEQKKKTDGSKPKNSDDVPLITFQDIIEISTIHSNLMTTFTNAEWLQSGRSNRASCDYLTPLLERYTMFSSLWDRVSVGLGDSLDSNVIPSLMILTAYARGLNDGEDYLDENSLKRGTSIVKPNFYHSPWVSETKKCLPTIELVITTTTGHLAQWPDFPTLNDIMIVARRILDFPLTSPVARFLTGLELLRDKIEEWNKSAHKGNNMIDVGLAVAQHIVTWRKLELTNWKDSLNNTFERVQSGAHKWWFHIYTLIDCFLFEKPMETNDTDAGSVKPNGEAITIKEFVTAMQRFMEKSSLAEYNKRLEMLFIFHCHSVHLDCQPRKPELISILWNLYNFYSLYSTQVTQAIKDLRTPIEKKLRDFVKICSWERDLSYWAVKDLVDKAHRTLHKHMKEFEGVLQSNASNFFSANKKTEKGTETTGIWDRPKRVSNAPTYHYMIDPQNYAIPLRSAKKFFAESDKLNENSEELGDHLVLLPRAPSLFNKAKTLCKETILNCMYPGLIQSLDGFVTEVIDTSKHLQELEISADLPKNKQKSQAKGHLQQKKKALADLFRTLSKMGVSYRTGLVEESAREGVIVKFEVAPVNLNAAFSYLQNKRCDNVLLSVWDGCETYYQRCISRLSYLLNALSSPSPDLGPQNIGRIRGYSIHLMLLVQKQKKKITKHSRSLYLLRNQVAQITTLCDSEAPYLSQEVLRARLNILNDTLCTVIMTVEQFDLVLKAYPPQPTSIDNKEAEIAFDLAITDNSMVKCYKFDAAWHEVNAKLKQILVNANKQKSLLKKIMDRLPFVMSVTDKFYNKCFLSQTHAEVMNETLLQINEISSKISDVLALYDLKITDPETGASKFINPVVKSLRYLNDHLNEKITVLNPLGADDVELKLCFENTAEVFSNEAESLINFILLKIQQIYKKYTNSETVIASTNTEDTGDATADVAKNEDEEETENLIQDNHLKKELHENINSDLLDLELMQLIIKLDSVIAKYVLIMKNDAGSVAACKKQFLKCIPLLEQVSLIAQFFITQQVAAHRVSCKMFSVLLNIFNELGSKGFCIPSELGLEGDGESQGNMSGGMGLADGEGEKDVSDRIENQDQLDDAHKPGEEKKKENDKDCKEEDNGIEMTDDFESHLQDLEEKEGSDNEEDEEDDADKQMGDTEAGADKLDEQIWGSDDEETEENENENQEKEEKGNGKSLDDKQIGAKEDSSKNDEEPETGGDEKKDKKKKDINEMEEPEYDDDQVDPYHGKQKPLPEPEPMDLPDDVNVDDEDGKEDNEEEGDDKNPFEIDVMNDKKESPEEENAEEESDKSNKDKGQPKDDRDDITDDEDGDLDDKPEDSEKQDKMEEDIDDDNKSDEDGIEMDQNNPDTEELPQEEEESSKPPPKIPGDEKNEENSDNEEPDDESKKNDPKEEARPSHDKPTSEDNVESSAAEKGSKDMVQTNPQIDKEQEAAPYEQSQEQQGDEKDAVGQSEVSENQKGHKGDRQDRPQSNARENAKKEKEQRMDKRNKPGSTDQDRALGEVKEPVQKKMKTINMQDKEKEIDDNKEEEEGAADNDNEELEADLYQHIKQAKETDTQAIDAATKEQAEKQPVPNKPEDENVDDVNPDDDIEMDLPENMEIDDTPVDKLEPENVGQDKKKETKDKSSEKGEKGDDATTGDTALEVEGDNILTMGVERGADTSYHTKLDMVRVPYSVMEPSSVTGASFRDALHQQTHGGNVNAEETAVWHSLWGRTATQARMLTEKLRLVLEPTGLSRLAGDYRTGRRINMRRVIPYIASHFRKDRIWLRRTRPARREYHIAVAIDDSSSMCDNQSKELAFESLALVSQALNLLEAGELAVLSFGEDTKVLHSFGEQFTESSGCKLLHHLTFQQTKTRIAQLLDFSSVMFEEQCSVSSAPNAKLLLIVSDGRGIFSEGGARVVQAVRRARQQGVFMVYLIVDNPASKVSIMDIRTPVFHPVTNDLERLDSYLDSFPFPFYLILRDIAALPAVLSDALRQWFELAANIDKQ